MLPDPSLRILIVDESAVRAAILEDGLREAGYGNVLRISDRPIAGYPGCVSCGYCCALQQMK